MVAKQKSPLPFSDEKKPQWISVDLTEKQRADMRARFAENSSVNDALLTLIEQGYKVTLSWDKFSKCFACYVFPVGDEHANSGHILSNRGASPFAALKGAVYRHFVVFDGDWGNREAQVVDED